MTAGFGSGGGGGGAFSGDGGTGSGGIVILRYAGSSVGNVGGSVTAGSGTATGTTRHTFATAGTSSFNLSSVDMNTRLGATLTGTGNLTKSGVGTFTLSGTLGGSGSIAGTVAVQSGATLAPGNSINSLSAGATSYASGSTFAYEVDSSLLANLAAAALRRCAAVQAAYLLGSAAGGFLRADSDVDVAHLPSQRTGLSVEERLRLTAELAAISGRAVDLGVLSTASVVYAKEAVTKARLLCERGRTETARFAMLALSIYASLQEIRREVLRAYAA